MKDIRFSNNNQYFQKLVEKAVEASRDGKITPQEMRELEALAGNDKTITRDEKLFLSALKIDSNIKILSKANSEISHNIDFVMKVPENELKKEEYSGNDYRPKVIPGEKVNDVGENVFDKTYFDSSVTPENISDSILKLSLFSSNPSLKSKTDELIQVFKNDKEALIYLKEIFNKKPPLTEAQLENVVVKFGKMMKEDYDSRISSSRDVVVSALHDIAAPSDISQGNVGSCGGTSVQVQVAVRDPEEYLNIIDKLSKNQSYITKKGDEIKPNWTFINEGTPGSIDTRRRLSSKIIQNAFMDFANGSQDYDSSKVSSGLYAFQEVNIMKSLFGKDYVSYENDDFSGEQLLKIISNSNPSPSNPVLLGISYDQKGNDGFHAVNVIGINNSKKEVTIINPWGREETFNIKELKSRLFSVVTSKGMDSNIKKLSDEEFQNLLNSPNLKTLLASSKGAEILDSLKFEQKIDLLKKVSESVTSTKDKKIVLSILNHLFQGDSAKVSNIIPEVISNMKRKNLDLVKILSDVKSKDPSFEPLVQKLFLALNTWDDSYKDKFTGLAELMSSETVMVLLNNMHDDKKILNIVRQVEGDFLAKYHGTAVTSMYALLNCYIYNNLSTIDEISKFIDKIESSCKDKKSVFQAILYQEETLRQFVEKGGEKAQAILDRLKKYK